MPTVSNACQDLLARSKRFAPLYGDRLANHLPMTLIALDRMGASPAAMERCFMLNARSLLPCAGDGAAVPDPRAWLGKGVNADGLGRFFQDAMRDDGVDAVLRAWVPLLMPGLAGSAFHCLIRLAYAIDAGDQDEASAALAYWVMEYAALALPMEEVAETPAAIAARMADAIAGHAPWSGIIVDRMLQVARHPAVAAAAMQPSTLDLRQVAQFALDTYHAREDFTLLHTVTASHAFRLVLPYAGDRQLALRYLWQAVVVAGLTVEPAAPAPAAMPAEAAGWDWPQCLRAAAQACDPHVVKLCYSAYCEDREYDDPRYLAIAVRKLGAGPFT